MVFRAPDGRYMIVTSDAMEGGEGKYRVGFSETSEYDGEHIKVAGKSVTLADIKQGLAGLADGSLVIGENRLESATTRENAPVLNEGVVRRQATAQSANEAQRAENGGVSIVENASRHAIELENKSIKDQMREHLDELSAMDPVAKISYERLPNKEKLRQKLVEEFSKYGTQVDREAFGAIQISKEEISTGLNYVYTDAEYAAFFAVPKILKRGIVISGHPDHKGRSYGTITIAAPIEINGQRVIVGVVVKQAGKNRYKTHRVLLPDGKELRGDNEKNTGSTVARHALQKEDQRSAINPVSNTSIPQNTEKSTDSEKKVAEVDGSNRSALPRTRARGEKTRAQVKAEKKASASAAERIAQEMRTENGRGDEGATDRAVPSRGYTDAEANEARDLVKDFDLFPHSVRRSIVELIRSGKASGASKNFLKHSANLIAYWRRGLWVIADDKTRDDGFYTTFTDGSRLIVVKPNREAKAVSETLMHELAHDVWARADAATRKVLYELATAGVKQEEIDAIRERYRKELTKRGELEGGSKEEVEALLDEEVATNLIGEIIGKEEFLKRFDGTETSTLKRILRTLSNMKKRFTGKDKYLYRKADDLFKAFTKVMALEEVGEIDGGERTRRALPSKKDPSKLDPRTVTREDVYNMLKNAEEGKYDEGKYIPVRIGTPAIVIEWIKKRVGKTIPNYPLIMQVKKITGALERRGFGDDGLPNRFEVDEIISIIEAMSNPSYIVHELPNKEHTESRFAEVVKFNLKSGRKAVAVLELVGEYKSVEHLLENYEGGTYNVFVTVYPPTSKTLGDLLNSEDSVIIYDKKKDFSQVTSGSIVPSVLNDPSFFDDSIYQNEPKVNTSGENILSEEDQSLLFDEEFYSRYAEESKKKIVDDVAELEMLRESEDFTELSDDEAYEVNAKLKALKAGYSTVYDYYVETEKKKLLEDYAKNGTRSRTYRLLEEKRKKFNKAKKLEADVSSATPLQKAQFNIIQATNPMYDDYHTGIRSPKEIKTFQEVVDDPESFSWGDFSREDARRALKRGTIKIYSSYKIENGVFVSTSYRQALDYASGNPDKVHVREVPLDSVAWINGDEGQYADTGAVSENAGAKRSALSKPSGDEMIRQAVARGYGDKAGANSQTSEKIEEKKPVTKPKKTAAQVARENAERRAAAEMAQVEEQAARRVRNAEKSAENAKKNAEKALAVEMAQVEEKAARRVRNAERSAANAIKNAEKKAASEKERLEREQSETIKRNSREIARIDKNLDYLKNAVLHRRDTDGGIASSIIFEDPALRAVVKRLASRGTAYGLMHKSTREGMQDLLAWYRPDNEILNGNDIDELLSVGGRDLGSVFGAYNADIRDKIERIANGDGDIAAAELADLDIIVNAIASLYLNYGTVMYQGKRVSAEELAYRAYQQQMDTRRDAPW